MTRRLNLEQRIRHIDATARKVMESRKTMLETLAACGLQSARYRQQCEEFTCAYAELKWAVDGLRKVLFDYHDVTELIDECLAKN